MVVGETAIISLFTEAYNFAIRIGLIPVSCEKPPVYGYFGNLYTGGGQFLGSRFMLDKKRVG